METSKNIAETMLDAGCRIADVQLICDDARPYVVVPEGHTVADLEHLLPAPTRKTAKVIVSDSASFILYAKKHGSLDECLIYAAIDSEKSYCKLVAVIDDNGADKPQWREHRCTFAPKLSVEWARWTAANRKGMSQADFGTFLEDNLPDIATVPGMPSGADILQMALAFDATSNKRFRSKTNLQSGGYSIEFVDEENNDTRQSMKVFERFTIGIPVFDGSTSAYPIEARLKYRESGGKLNFWYELIRQDRVFKTAVADELTAIKEATGFPILYGQPE